MNKITKKDFLISKYNEMFGTIMEQPFAHKFNDFLPSLETTEITSVILFIHLTFVGKDIEKVIKRLLKEKEVDLDENHISQLVEYIHEFLQFLELINML